MFIYKTSKEVNDMTDEQLDTYQKELKAHEAELRAKEISEATEAVKTELKAELEKATKANAELEAQIKELKDSQVGKAETKNQWVELEKAIEEKAEVIKNQKSTGTIANFQIKAAPDPILTTSVTSAVGGNVVAMTESTGNLYATNDNRLFAEGIMSAMSTSADQITYIDEVAGEGGAGMTAEGGTKSQSNTDYVERTLVLQNVTHFIKVSTKMLKQPNYIVQAVRNTLLRKLNLKKQEQLLSGNGTAPQIKGIKEWATAYDGTPYAGSVIEANLNDLIRVCVGLIQAEADDFYPNYVVVSHKRLADMDLKKASDGHYVLPPFSSLDNRTIAGVRVISSNEFTDDELLIGDFTKANYVYRDTIDVSINLDGNDFTKNLRTILAEQEIGLYVSANETGAFILVDDIDQAISDLTVAP